MSLEDRLDTSSADYDLCVEEMIQLRGKLEEAKNEIRRLKDNTFTTNSLFVTDAHKECIITVAQLRVEIDRLNSDINHRDMLMAQLRSELNNANNQLKQYSYWWNHGAQGPQYDELEAKVKELEADNAKLIQTHDAQSKLFNLHRDYGCKIPVWKKGGEVLRAMLKQPRPTQTSSDFELANKLADALEDYQKHNQIVGWLMVALVLFVLITTLYSHH
jgi:FtsZ-binding cell division protein ZapB